MALATRDNVTSNGGGIPRRHEVDALRSGAAMLSREGNRIAALALLTAAVGIDPMDFAAHRRLAAALADAGDADAAAAEYARFIELLLGAEEVRRAAEELAHGLASLGEMSELRAAAAHLVPLGQLAEALNRPTQTSRAPAGAISNSIHNGPPPESLGLPDDAEATTRQMRVADPLTRTFDGLAARIDAMGLRSLGFTSSLSREGVSTIALGTSLALATLRQDKVLLVDANWVQPTLTLDAISESKPGLADLLANKAQLSAVIRPLPRSRLAFLPVGDRDAARPTTRALAGFLANGVASFQTVIVDLPPILAGEAFVLPWAAVLDQLFVVVREAATPLPLVRRALEKVGLATPQIVLNRAAVPSGTAETALLAAGR